MSESETVRWTLTVSKETDIALRLMRVILDTNVLVSALLTPDGRPALLLDAWLDGPRELITSEC